MKITLIPFALMMLSLPSLAQKTVVIDVENLGLRQYQTSREQGAYIVDLFFDEVLKGKVSNHQFEKEPLAAKPLATLKLELAVRHQLELLETEVRNGTLSQREMVGYWLTAMRILAESCRETNLFDKALEIYDELLVTTRGTTLEIEALSHKASVHRALGEWDREIDLLVEASSSQEFLRSPNPDHNAAHVQILRKLAYRFTERGDEEQAALTFSELFREANRLAYFDEIMKSDLEQLQRLHRSVGKGRLSVPDLETARKAARNRQRENPNSDEVLRAHHDRTLDVVLANWRETR